MLHCFDLPFETLSDPVRAGKSRAPLSKRKRDVSRSASDSEDEEQYADDAQALSSGHSRHSEHGADEEDVVPNDFPHAPLNDALQFSPLPKSASNPQSLKQQHLIVLATIMHRSLIDHEFDRAARAFAMLIRAEHGGKHVDLRKKRLWGIAAEILLHQDVQGSFGADATPLESNENVEESHENNEENHQVPARMPRGFSQEGYKAARTFYDRLILQYPYKKSRPHDVNALTFYPAMFGLWISRIQDATEAMLLKNKRGHHALDSPSSTTERNHSKSRSRRPSTVSPRSSHNGSEGDDDEESENHQRHRKIKLEELRQAQEVAQRLDELTLLPPYDQDIKLLQLKGMVALWIADLCPLSPNGESEESEQRQKAIAAFRHVRRCGGHLWAGVARLLED